MQKRTERKGTIGAKIVILLILSIVINSLSIGIFSYMNYIDNPINLLMILLTGTILFALLYFYLYRSISSPLKEIVKQSRLLKEGDIDADVQEKYLKRNDEIGMLGREFAELASHIKEQTILSGEIAAGNLSIEVNPKSQKDVMTISMNSIVNTLRKLIEESDKLRASAVEGNLGHRLDSAQFEGGYRELIEGFNITLDTVIEPLGLSTEYIEKIGRGDIPKPIEDDLKGDFGKIRDSINLCITSINRLMEDTERISSSALADGLEVAADVELHQGDFRKAIEGVSSTLDKIRDKNFWYEQILDAVPFPLSVTDLNMNWTFINKPVESILNVKRSDVLGMHCSNWNADICKTENCGIVCLGRGEEQTQFEQNDMNFQVNTAYIYNNKNEKIGHIEVVQDITASVRSYNYQMVEVERLSNNLRHLSDGNLEMDFNVSEADSYTKLDRENFILMNDDLKSARDSIDELINNATLLTQAAIEGKLNARADADKSKGAWKALVSGMNNILEEIAKPIKDVTDVMNQISEGHLDVAVSGSYKGDFDELAQAVNGTSARLDAVVREISNTIREIAGGNLNLEKVKE